MDRTFIDASLTVYGDKIQFCGGRKFSYRSGTKECFQLNISISEHSHKWEKFAELPVDMYGHSSVQVLDDMWVLFTDSIYVVPQKGITYRYKWPYGELPMHSCAQTNGVNTIVIPDGLEDVYINTDVSSPESWEKLVTLPTDLKSRACLMMNSLIYVTGGKLGNGGSRETYVIDIQRRNVTKVGDLLTGRHRHAMCVIDGEPAVFGGRDSSLTKIGIETFDKTTKTWKQKDINLVVASDSVATISFPVG